MTVNLYPKTSALIQDLASNDRPPGITLRTIAFHLFDNPGQSPYFSPCIQKIIELSETPNEESYWSWLVLRALVTHPVTKKTLITEHRLHRICLTHFAELVTNPATVLNQFQYGPFTTIITNLMQKELDQDLDFTTACLSILNTIVSSTTLSEEAVQTYLHPFAEAHPKIRSALMNADCLMRVSKVRDHAFFSLLSVLASFPEPLSEELKKAKLYEETIKACHDQIDTGPRCRSNYYATKILCALEQASPFKPNNEGHMTTLRSLAGASTREYEWLATADVLTNREDHLPAFANTNRMHEFLSWMRDPSTPLQDKVHCIRILYKISQTKGVSEARLANAFGGAETLQAIREVYPRFQQFQIMMIAEKKLQVKPILQLIYSYYATMEPK